jgi:Protein of unknown function (DUF3768)
MSAPRAPGAPENASAARRRIRELNDAFRAKGPLWASALGLARPDHDGWYITDGVNGFGPLFALEAVGAVQRFDSFNADNDPHGEHDFGAFELAGQRLFFKIDTYDLELSHGSDDPANPNVTRRVITIMLAEEY